ncbi:toll/interleukin-1 receptor domain-containing protein [Streptomyces sp. NPDC060064]|uniref:toll/interleukin-1 receptor domain-containing protein n=1 Tax=Streptomyces sp. NPDC060064 TaxID=3347049 RepID=UPI0036D0B981
MNDWHPSHSGDWTALSTMLTGHGGGIGEYAASYVTDLAPGPVLNGRVSADIRLTERWGTGAGLVCRADRDWTFVAFYTAPQVTAGTATTVARIGVFREGMLTPVAQLSEPVVLARGYNHFSLEFFSGRVRGEIRTGERTYELLANCPHVPFPGYAGLVRLYSAGVLAKSVVVERTQLPFVAPAVAEPGGREFVYDVFLCHSKEDAVEVGRIAAALAEKGISYWLDSEQISFGDFVTQKIDAGLQASHFVIPCISKNLTKGGWTKNEYGAILNAEFSGDSSRVAVPLMLAGAEVGDIPMTLRDKRRVSRTNKVEFEEFVSFLRSH